MPLRTSDQEDNLKRLMRQAAEALRWLRGRIEGGEPPLNIRADAASAIASLLGPEAPLLGMLDAVTASRLLGNAERVTLWAELVDVDADAALAAGDSAVASERRRRASDLRTAASIAGPHGTA
jgi:hypothetical protein